jgi:hypothetical protein
MASLWIALRESVPGDTELVTVDTVASVYAVAIVLVGEGGRSKKSREESGELDTVENELLVAVGEGGASIEDSELRSASKFAFLVGVSGRSQGYPWI